MFSIIVPVYKVESYLSECIDSILSQTYKDFELILVDDGSPDSCPQICDEYAKNDERIKVIHKENGGHTSARNAGLKAASREYICFVDSDDYIDSGILQIFADIIDKYSPEVTIADCIRFNEESQTLLQNRIDEGFYTEKALEKIKENLIYSSEFSDINLGTITFSLWNKCFKKEALAKYCTNLPNGIALGEDMGVTMPLIADCKSLYVSRAIGYYYRNTPTSIVNSFRAKDLEQTKKLVNHLNDAMPKHHMQISVYFAYIAKNYLLKAARSCSSFKEFKALAKNSFHDNDRAKIREIKSIKMSFKNKVSLFLIAHKLYFPLYILAKSKK